MKSRPIRIEGDVAYVPLTKGYEAIIDAADVPLLAGFNWCAQEDYRKDGTLLAVYAVRAAPAPDGPYRQIKLRMHRVICAAADGLEVDHRDSNGLNNRRCNLRVATKAQNLANQRTRPDNSSGAKGVTFHKATGKWQPQIMVNGSRVYLGLFVSVEEAAAAYAKASAELHGEFGRTA